jgi:hypothetical protein
MAGSVNQLSIPRLGITERDKHTESKPNLRKGVHTNCVPSFKMSR